MQCASALQVTIALNLRSQVGNPQTEIAAARDCADHIIANPEVEGVQAQQLGDGRVFGLKPDVGAG